MADKLWVLNDTVPLSLTFEFEPPPPPWTVDQNYYGPPLSMIFGPNVPGAAPGTGLANHKFLRPGFFGPRG